MLIERLFGLRGNADPVVCEAKWIFENEMRYTVGVHQGKACRSHAARRVTEHGHLGDAEVLQ